MKKIILIITLSIISLSVVAGDKGNGGGVHVCEKSVELYDFYEGRHAKLHNLEVWESNSQLSVTDYIERALNRIKEVAPKNAVKIKQAVYKILSQDPDDYILPISIPNTFEDDIPWVDYGCEYKIVANWNERFNFLSFNKNIFDQLDNMSKAGLYLHEVLYRFERLIDQVNDSNNTRKLVAKIFSNEKLSLFDFEHLTGDVYTPEDGILFQPPGFGVCNVRAEIKIRSGEKLVNKAGLAVAILGAPEFMINLDLDTDITYQKSDVDISCRDIKQKGLLLSAFYSMNRKIKGKISFSLFINERKLFNDIEYSITGQRKHYLTNNILKKIEFSRNK